MEAYVYNIFEEHNEGSDELLGTFSSFEKANRQALKYLNLPEGTVPDKSSKEGMTRYRRSKYSWVYIRKDKVDETF